MDSQKERWDRVQREFALVGIKPERFSGISHRKRHVGCRKSHQAIIGMAKENGWERVLIFEDDVIFINDTVKVFDEATKQLPAEWDMLYLGCFKEVAKRYSANLIRLKTAKCGHAVVFNQSIYDLVLSSKEKSMDRTNYALIIPRDKSFCVVPMIAEQKEYRIPSKRWEKYVK
jgi:glycosyl transferase family 25